MADAFAAVHGAQLRASGFPEALYERLRQKLEAEARRASRTVFDAGAAFQVQQLPDGTRRAVCIAAEGLAPAQDVFLVDHAWTFRAADARAQLAAMPQLLSRVAAMAGVRVPPATPSDEADADGDDCPGADSASGSDYSSSDEEESAEEGLRPHAWRGDCGAAALPDRVLAAAWRLCGHYRLAGAAGTDAEATWYLMDEFGAAVRHSAAPTLAVVPFMYAPHGSAAPPQPFSIAWPLRAMAPDDEATRDALPNVATGPHRVALLACFFRARRSRRAAHDAAFADALRRWEATQAGAAGSCGRQPGGATAMPLPVPPLPLRVFTDIDWMVDHLRRPEFAVVTRAADAGVLWLKAPCDDAAVAALGARRDVLVNQFPGEEALVFKHLLPRTAAAAAGALGEGGWLPQTFDASAELDAMLGAHNRAVEAGETPLWIMKPWNLARSMDATVAPSLAAVAAASLTGPKVAQRYVASPALYRGRKFDVRVLVAVRSFAPQLDALTWGTVYVRAANRAYTASPAALGDFQTQFTSMRQGGFEEDAVSVADLAAELAAQGLDWAAAEARMRAMIHALLLAAGQGPVAAACTALAPECGGAGAFPRARALYGVDVMFDAALNPKLLEVTFCPGVERPMASDALFFDKLFGCLFLGDSAAFEPL